MQLSGILGVRLLLALGFFEDKPMQEGLQYATIYWTIFSFTVALMITLLLLRKERHMRTEKIHIPQAVFWSIGGIFLAMIAQSIAGVIEMKVFGIEPGSENTEFIVELVRITPMLIVVTSVIGPILEEIIFRKIIFGSLHKRFNFFISALISSVIFAAVHMDFIHILIYTAMGFVFAFLYAKTKTIIVPIFAHVAMNTIVVLMQTIFADKIEELQKQAEQLQFIFGGF